MHKVIIFMYIILVVVFGSESKLNRQLLQGSISCCKDLGANCGCRQSCGGSPCTSNGGALCNTGVCCCGNNCNKPELDGADVCPTDNPTSGPTKNPTPAPTENPTKNPTKGPTPAPTNNPSKAPSKNPTSNPTKAPSKDPTMSPVYVCPEWSPESSQPSSSPVNGEINVNIPTPDFSGSPQLCQVGKSGSWNNLDQWYSWDCSCYDVTTLYKLNQLIASMFVEFQINFKNEEPGRFESYFNNYISDDISFKTSVTTESGVSTGPSWNGLEDLTSCDPGIPGHGELTRSLPYHFEIAPGGIYMDKCSDDGNVARARVNILNYRIRDNSTETQVSFGYLTVERQANTNIWLYKEIEFGGATVGYLSEDEA